MAVIAPQTDVYLLKVPLEINDINQLTFANATAQYNYFNSLPKLTVNDFTYQRKDGVIRYGACIDDLITYNYVMYRNDAYSNKWFYAYIEHMEYVNDNVTKIYIVTDTWQTWQFDLVYKPCMIDREHVNDDTIGLHTLPEDLELGEMICNGSTTNFGGGSNDNVVVVEVSQIENDGDSATLSYSWASGSHDSTPTLNGIQRGTVPLIVGYNENWQNQASYVTRIYDLAGLADSIINIYQIPKNFVGDNPNQLSLTVQKDGTTRTITDLVVPTDTNSTISISTDTFTRPTTLNGYTPVNKKLLTWPFCYFTISNNAGNSQPYRYEDFSSTVTFKTEGTFGVSGSTKALPQNYRNVSASGNTMDFSISGPKYPVCSWRSDSYTNWLTQNAVNMDREQLYSGLQGAARAAAVGGAMLLTATGAGAGIGLGMGAAILGSAAAAGASPLIDTVYNQMRAKTQANMVADQVGGNTNAGDFLWAKYRSPFTYMPMSIKAEYARCCDNFLSMFGYKINRVKTPNITGRKNWNYVKTIGCYIEADIPQEDLSQIKSMFDRGITLWHDPTTFMDYSQNNAII